MERHAFLRESAKEDRHECDAEEPECGAPEEYGCAECYEAEHVGDEIWVHDIGDSGVGGVDRGEGLGDAKEGECREGWWSNLGCVSLRH